MTMTLVMPTELPRVDLNLLIVLEALLLDRHVTNAARRLHSSQPAVSRALSRLRELFEDPLLVRVGADSHPTEKARALLQPLGQLLADARELVAPTRFDPASETGVVRLAVPD